MEPSGFSSPSQTRSRCLDTLRPPRHPILRLVLNELRRLRLDTTFQRQERIEDRVEDRVGPSGGAAAIAGVFPQSIREAVLPRLSGGGGGGRGGQVGLEGS